MKSSLDSSSAGGVSGHHTVPADAQFLVAPTTEDAFARTLNVTRMRLIPIACWRVDDIRFRFDSSLILPGTEAELRALAELVKTHPGAPLSVFGHTDPVGSDDYNKGLSGRRAKAIYAMLIRDAAMWDELFLQPQGRDNWGKDGIDIMHTRVHRDDPGGPQPAPGTLHHDAGARKQLFLKYMDLLCGPDLKLEKTDFLARGADAQGKADFQGCSEFNPLRIFSAARNAEFERSQDKSDRNVANAVNRRVMVLLFRKGSRIDPAKWPCPRATEGVAKCFKRFWSDGEKRRSRRDPDNDRTFEETEDTFACRFYQRLTSQSPCESLPQTPINVARFVGPDNERTTEVQLHICDGAGKLLKAVPASLADESAEGYAIFQFDPRVLPSPVLLKWNLPDGEEHLAGPCNPTDLRDNLEELKLNDAEPQIEPAVTKAATVVTSSNSTDENPMPFEDQWRTLRDVLPSSLV